MSFDTVKRAGRFRIYRSRSSEALSDQTLIGGFQRLSKEDPSEVTSGRGAVCTLLLDDGSKAVLRLYRRGGIIQRVLKQSFVNVPGNNRVRSELEILEYLQNQRVPVPTPLAGIFEHCLLGLAYRAGIATREIERAENFLDRLRSIDHTAEAASELAAISSAVGRAAASMLQSGVFHCDLHPGNVLVAADGSVRLIDFDKAKRFEVSSEMPYYRARTVQRWERAIGKLSASTQEMLGDSFGTGLRASLAE